MRFALLLATVTLAAAQGTPPKTAPADYPVHVQMDSVTLAAEYLVHSLPTAKGTLVANDYLVVEAAFFGPLYSRLKMSPDNFSLRINGRGEPLTPELPGMVAQSIKFPGVRPHLETTGSVSAGDGTVTIGPRPPQSRFPGDGNDRTPVNQPPTVTEINHENAVEYRVQAASLPEGEHSLPRSGLLYFFYRGKTKNIRSVELFYNGPMGKATLKLLP
jgi:hypothetical protein